MEKQQLSESTIVKNYVFSVFAAASIIGLLPMAAFYAIVGPMPNEIIESATLGIINIAAVFFGVLYGAKSVSRKYSVADPDKIILSSYIYISLIWLLFFLPISMLGTDIFSGGSIERSSIAAGIDNFSGILSTLVFVVASRKYLKS